MRAENLPRILSATRAVVALSIVLILIGCKTEKDPDPVRVLGSPPENAYLGVEYSYNFGADGGEGILDYSLTNAPSWLALEDINNKARQGVIMRGVPGLTGGNRGESDLGTTQDINLVTTDGQAVGLEPFDINVKVNPLSLASETFVEGERAEPPEEFETNQCAIPDISLNGEHTITYNEYASDGSVVSVEQATLPTRPVLVRILLDQPSVTEISVAFSLESNFNENNCDTDFAPPHQRCDQSESNEDDAVIGRDVIALGSGSQQLLGDIDYLFYEPDSSGASTSGVVTLSPGTTECFIRLEVIEDGFPERTENFTVRLTEVRSGLASLGRRDTYAKAMSIEDNEPVVSLKTAKGGGRDTLNIGQSKEFTAVLTGKRSDEIRAKLASRGSSTAIIGTDFYTQLQSPGGIWEDADEIVFPVGTDEVTFRVQIEDSDSFSNLLSDDKFALIEIDATYQAGRPNHARGANDAPLRISLNELTSPLIVNGLGAEEFMPTDISVEQNGNIFVAGYEPLNGDRIVARIYSRQGELIQEVEVAAPANGFVADISKGPLIATSQRDVRDPVTGAEGPRYEFGVAYNISSVETDGMDIVISKFIFDPDSNGGEYTRSWEISSGTTGDDAVQAIDVNSAGNIVIAGATNDAWPDQASAGNFDSFVQTIDGVLDGSEVTPQVSSTRQVGYTGDEQVAGVTAGDSIPLVMGWSSNLEGGPDAIGEPGGFSYSVSSSSSNVNVNQVATELGDRIVSGASSSSNIWFLGNGRTQYLFADRGNGAAPSYEREPLSSEAGFVVGISRFGNIRKAFSLNDKDDSQKDEFSDIILFNGDLVVSGLTEGRFNSSAEVLGQHGVLSRISLTAEPGEVAVTDSEDTSSGDEANGDETSGEYSSSWRFQSSLSDTEVSSLANYRDDEITALVRSSNDWQILLFGPEGDALNP
ncbi:hypothetical protein [Marinobacter sp. F4216]|uniref:hypothetical protein n=1 Tax=Marinobacter sp. F4216 TaxID=2874281 RepID=UPI001CBBEC02|nr:hypothetical protein [Marinobacter sp. F4216]MBZ2170072.1 hypothetical protein [Marinobacter sp. F4216]